MSARPLASITNFHIDGKMWGQPRDDSQSVDTNQSTPQERSMLSMASSLPPTESSGDLAKSASPGANEDTERDPKVDLLLAEGERLIQETAQTLLGQLPDSSTASRARLSPSQQVASLICSGLSSTARRRSPSPPTFHAPYQLPIYPSIPYSHHSTSIQWTNAAAPAPKISKEESVATLTRLGSSRLSKSDPYVDCSQLEDPDDSSLSSFPELFPEKLHRMLEDVERDGNQDIVSFCTHGRAFVVLNVERFESEVLPHYFERQKNWGSFYRQLHLYGFSRCTNSKDEGGYYHPLFLRGRKRLCRFMKRVRKASGSDQRSKGSTPDPDFYAMPSL